MDEHIQMIESAGALAFKVKHSNDLAGLDGLVLPGGGKHNDAQDYETL